MNRAIRFVFLSVVGFFVMSGFMLWQNDRRAPLISPSQFDSRVAEGRISSVAIAGSVAYVFDKQGGSFRVLTPSNRSDLIADLQQHGVKVWISKSAEHSWPIWLLKLESKLRFGL